MATSDALESQDASQSPGPSLDDTIPFPIANSTMLDDDAGGNTIQTPQPHQPDSGSPSAKRKGHSPDSLNGRYWLTTSSKRAAIKDALERTASPKPFVKPNSKPPFSRAFKKAKKKLNASHLPKLTNASTVTWLGKKLEPTKLKATATVKKTVVKVEKYGLESELEESHTANGANALPSPASNPAASTGASLPTTPSTTAATPSTTPSTTNSSPSTSAVLLPSILPPPIPSAIPTALPVPRLALPSPSPPLARPSPARPLLPTATAPPILAPVVPKDPEPDRVSFSHDPPAVHFTSPPRVAQLTTPPDPTTPCINVATSLPSIHRIPTNQSSAPARNQPIIKRRIAFTLTQPNVATQSNAATQPNAATRPKAPPGAAPTARAAPLPSFRRPSNPAPPPSPRPPTTSPTPPALPPTPTTPLSSNSNPPSLPAPTNSDLEAAMAGQLTDTLLHLAIGQNLSLSPLQINSISNELKQIIGHFWQQAGDHVHRLHATISYLQASLNTAEEEKKALRSQLLESLAVGSTSLGVRLGAPRPPLPLPAFTQPLPQPTSTHLPQPSSSRLPLPAPKAPPTKTPLTARVKREVKTEPGSGKAVLGVGVRRVIPYARMAVAGTRGSLLGNRAPSAFMAPSARSAGHTGLNLRRKAKPKLAAGPSRRSMEELYPELPENLYNCNCYAPKPLIYDQLGVAPSLEELVTLFATRSQVDASRIRVVETTRTPKLTTARGAFSYQAGQFPHVVRREQESLLLLVCHNENHKCAAKYQVVLVVQWEFWGSREEAESKREELLASADNLPPLKRKSVETDEDMIHTDSALGATYFAGCAWSRFQKDGGCKWSRSDKPRRFDPYDDPDLTQKHSTYSALVYQLADKAADAMAALVPQAFANMTKIKGFQCRIGDRHRIFSAASINADACLKPHRDRRDTKDGCGALLSWQRPDRPVQLHYIFNLRLASRPTDSVVALDLGFGSCAFEVAGMETHATTPPHNANRQDPTRLSYVLFMHRGLDRPLHASKL